MEVRKISFITRIKDAFIGVILGIALFFGSFFVLYVNEGLDKFAEVIEGASEIQYNQSEADGVVVHTNIVKAEQPIRGDGQFISGGNFLYLNREVEVFAWEEIRETRTDSEVGGSQTERTSYQYKQQWVDIPQRTSQFYTPQGHTNPEKTIQDEIWYADGVSLGAHPIQDIRSVSLHNTQLLALDDVTLVDGVVYNDYIYIPKDNTGRPESPALGDHRIRYQIVSLDKEMTFVGAFRNATLRKHADPQAFDLFVGDREDALSTAKKNDAFRIWGLRLLGFLMMAIGLFLVVNPLVVLLDVVPLFGTVSRFVALLAALLLSLLMSIVTILVSKLFHNIIALSVVIGITIVLAVYFFTRRRGPRRPRRPRRNQPDVPTRDEN